MGKERPRIAPQRSQEGRQEERGGQAERAATTTPLSNSDSNHPSGDRATRKGPEDGGWSPKSGQCRAQASLCGEVPRPPHPFPRGEPENLFFRAPPLHILAPVPGHSPHRHVWRDRGNKQPFTHPVATPARSREEQIPRTSSRHDRQSRCSRGSSSSPSRQRRDGRDCGGGSDCSVAAARPLDVAGAAAALDKSGWARKHYFI